MIISRKLATRFETCFKFRVLKLEEKSLTFTPRVQHGDIVRAASPAGLCTRIHTVKHMVCTCLGAWVSACMSACMYAYTKKLKSMYTETCLETSGRLIFVFKSKQVFLWQMPEGEIFSKNGRAFWGYCFFCLSLTKIKVRVRKKIQKGVSLTFSRPLFKRANDFRKLAKCLSWAKWRSVQSRCVS